MIFQQHLVWYLDPAKMQAFNRTGMHLHISSSTIGVSTVQKEQKNKDRPKTAGGRSSYRLDALAVDERRRIS